MSSVPLITFVVPTRNNRKIIAHTIDSISAQTIRDHECWVIDGMSTDGTVEFLRENYPSVRVIRKDADSGPAASRSIGMLRSSSPFVALVDSDVRLDEQWAERQLEVMRSDLAIGVAGTKLLYEKNALVLFSAHGAMNRYGVSWDGGQGELADAFNEPRECIWANTSALLIRRDVIERAGGFDDRMFAGCEDSDFGWRANLCGFHIVYNPAATALHEVHGTFDPSREYNKMLYLVRRNRLRSMLVNYGRTALIRYALPYSGLALADVVLGPHRKEKLQALFWNVGHLRETIARRRSVQSLRVVDDKGLWHLFDEGIRGPGGDSMGRLRRGVETLGRRESDPGRVQ
jgi:GT2 family glycosyltransferase